MSAPNIKLCRRDRLYGEDGFEVFTLNNDVKNLWRNILKEGAAPCKPAKRYLSLKFATHYMKELDVSYSPKESSLAWTLKNENNYLGKDLIEKNGPIQKLLN